MNNHPLDNHRPISVDSAEESQPIPALPRGYHHPITAHSCRDGCTCDLPVELLLKLPTDRLIKSIPCKVCGDRSSGVHYGVITCEGCKGFFRRTTEDKGSDLCKSGHIGPITRENRNRCKECRLRACKNAGMNIEVRFFGRMSRNAKVGIIHEVKASRPNAIPQLTQEAKIFLASEKSSYQETEWETSSLQIWNPQPSQGNLFRPRTPQQPPGLNQLPDTGQHSNHLANPHQQVTSFHEQDFNRQLGSQRVQQCSPLHRQSENVQNCTVMLQQNCVTQNASQTAYQNNADVNSQEVGNVFSNQSDVSNSLPGISNVYSMISQ